MGTFVSTKAYEAKTACASAKSSCGCGCFDKKTSVLLALDAIFMVSIYFVFTLYFNKITYVIYFLQFIYKECG